MSVKVIDAGFVTTAVDPESYPPEAHPEIAFVGRSNVGKSSMINALAGRRKLVRVSNTPGRTRTINFFDVTVELEGARRTVRLADLPGYGFAKASKTERKSWQAMISTYLDRRRPLRVVVSIIDGEVGPTADDFNTLDYLAEKDCRILVVATKMDRVAKARRKPRVQELTRALELPAGAVVGFSATDRLGVDDTWRTLLEALGETTQDVPRPG